MKLKVHLKLKYVTVWIQLSKSYTIDWFPLRHIRNESRYEGDQLWTNGIESNLNTVYRWTMNWWAEIASYYLKSRITSSGYNRGSPLKAFTFVNVFTTSQVPELFMASKNPWRTRNRGRQSETRMNGMRRGKGGKKGKNSEKG